MTKAVQKITLSPSRDIPFNKLVLSQSNVRRVKAGVSIEQLAESIAQRTLLQSLNVRAVLDGEGDETGMFGARRYRALELLVKQKRMAKTQVVPCVVREAEEEDPARPLLDRLIIELTAHRTLALRDALAENPAIAFQAVLHNFVLTAFYRFASSGSCLEIWLRTPTFPAQAPGLRESVSAKAVEVRHEGWNARLPKSENDLWDALTALDGGAQASLFAHCASFAVNAVYQPANRYNQGRVSAHGVRTRLDQANVLARCRS